MADANLHPTIELVSKICMSQEDLVSYCRPMLELAHWQCDGATASLLGNLRGAFVVIPAQYLATEACMYLAKRIRQVMSGALIVFGAKRTHAALASPCRSDALYKINHTDL